MKDDRLEAQIRFLIEVDKLKEIERRSYLISGARRENSAEHSWHLGMLTLVLSQYANDQIDQGKVLSMVLVHDLVEIDAGDTYCYDTAGNETKEERERAAADRLFGLLPEDQAQAMRALWEEFEAGRTPEARFANAVDRIMPILHSLRNERPRGAGRTWRENGVVATRVLERNQKIGEGSTYLWAWVKEELERAVREGVID